MQAFHDRMKRLLGAQAYEQFAVALGEAPWIGVRSHPAKGLALDANLQRVPWSSTGVCMRQRPSFTFDPLFHAGAYYVQEPSSMFVEQAVRVATEGLRQDGHRPLRCLDLCAAPGGKSTLLRSLLDASDLLICNEPMPARVAPLVQNIQRWGYSNTLVTNAYPRQLTATGLRFDLMLVDAPCSGEGMFRKDETARQQWTTALTEQCAALQREILADIWPALAPGGYLIYSTCTYNPDEDEAVLRLLRDRYGAEPVAIPVPEAWQIIANLTDDEPLPVYRFLPHRVQGEGFFLTMVRKPLDADMPTALKPKGRQVKPSRLPKPLDAWLQPGPWLAHTAGDTLYALTPEHAQLLAALDRVKVALPGLAVVTSKGSKWQPHPALALSLDLRREAFPNVTLSRDDALRYLRRESLTLPADTPRGFVLLCYTAPGEEGRSFPLGFANNIGTRANNLYPNAWRILSRNILLSKDTH